MDWPIWVRSLYSQGWDAEIFGYVASGLVLATFTMKSMRPLRVMAILSNIAFIYYAIAANIHPILILHGILLPLNALRLVQMQISPRETRLMPIHTALPGNDSNGPAVKMARRGICRAARDGAAAFPPNPSFCQMSVQSQGQFVPSGFINNPLPRGPEVD